MPHPNRFLILHGAAAGVQPLPPDEQDVLDEVKMISDSLRHLGYDPVELAVTLDLRPLCAAIRELHPIGVFNLVETVEQQGRFTHLPIALLDALDVPYTGCSATAIYETTAKLLTKQRLAAAGISTPAWMAPPPATTCDQFQPGRWILKPSCEDASIGLDAEAVVEVQDAAGLGRALARRAALVGHELFAEQFVEGREIGVSLLEGPEGVEALPPSEILFVDFPADRPHIVDYRAKWENDSFEYIHTPRSLDFAAADAPLLAELSRLARHCWDLFGLRGYARVDFRVDPAGRPWVLEVNANPALAADSGFIASVRHHGQDAPWAFRRIIECALPAAAPGSRRSGNQPPPMRLLSTQRGAASDYSGR